jgi:hypothetical protein
MVFDAKALNCSCLLGEEVRPREENASPIAKDTASMVDRTMCSDKLR